MSEFTLYDIVTINNCIKKYYTTETNIGDVGYTHTDAYETQRDNILQGERLIALMNTLLEKEKEEENEKC